MRKFNLTFLAVVALASVSAGNAQTVWQQTFDNAESFESFTIKDGNADGTTWKWSEKRKLALYDGDVCVNQANDWLISPALTLCKDKVYKLKYNTRSFIMGERETLGVYLGSSASPEALTTEVMAAQLLQPNVAQGNMERVIRVSADGTYYLGFHATSEAGQGYLMVDDVLLEEYCTTACPDAGEIAVAVGEQGRVAADILVVAPSKDLSGAPLSGNVTLKLMRCKHDHSTPQNCQCAWEEIWSKTDVKPGAQEITSDAKAESGLFTYRVVAVNGNGEGLPADYTVTVGMDLPRPVTGLTMTRAENGDVTLEWSASDKGVNDGYVSTKALRYNIAVAIGNNWYVLEEEYDGKSYTMTDLPWSGVKESYQFRVTPVNETGFGEPVKSTFFTTGEPYKIPFHDSFDINSMPLEEMPIWVIPDVDLRHWSLMGGISQDNDGLCAVACMESSEVTIDMLSAEMDFSKVKEPELEFWYFHTPKYGSPTLQVIISPEYGEWEVAHEIKLTAAEATSQWTKVSVPLDKYKDKKWIQFGWRASSSTPMDMLYVDNMTLYDKATQGIENVTEENGLTITGTKHGISLLGEGEARVYDLSGMLKVTVQVSGSKVIPCEPGLYIVVLNGKSEKLLVQ